MTAYQVQNPFFSLTDAYGEPVTGGRVFVGVAGQDPEVYPQTVYWDAGQTLPAAQPLSVSHGYIVNGTAPATPFTAPTYSIRAYDQIGNAIFYAASVSSPLGQFAGSTGASQIGTTAGISVESNLDTLNTEIAALLALGLSVPVPIAKGGTGAATLAAAFAAIVGTNTVALPGQFVFQDGTIVKFGQSVQVGTSGVQAVTFATPFPTQCIFGIAGNAGNGIPSAYHSAGTLTKTGMTVGSASASGVAAGAGTAAWWIAIGN